LQEVARFFIRFLQHPEPSWMPPCSYENFLLLTGTSDNDSGRLDKICVRARKGRFIVAEIWRAKKDEHEHEHEHEGGPEIRKV
jgi:hypothetical protein